MDIHLFNPNENSKIGIIIPTLNEEKSIGLVLTDIEKELKNINYVVIIVDGHSTDNTISISNNKKKYKT